MKRDRRPAYTIIYGLRVIRRINETASENHTSMDGYVYGECQRAKSLIVREKKRLVASSEQRWIIQRASVT